MQDVNVPFDLRDMGPTVEGELVGGLVCGLILIVLARGGRQLLIALGPRVPWARLRRWVPVVMPLALAVTWPFENGLTLVFVLLNLPVLAVAGMLGSLIEPWPRAAVWAVAPPVAWFVWWAVLHWLEWLSHPDALVRLDLRR